MLLMGLLMQVCRSYVDAGRSPLWCVMPGASCLKAPKALRRAARQSIAADMVDCRTAADATEAERASATRAALAQVSLLMHSEHAVT